MIGQTELPGKLNLPPFRPVNPGNTLFNMLVGGHVGDDGCQGELGQLLLSKWVQPSFLLTLPDGWYCLRLNSLKIHLATGLLYVSLILFASH